jgi:hypothetical protein
MFAKINGVTRKGSKYFDRKRCFVQFSIEKFAVCG